MKDFGLRKAVFPTELHRHTAQIVAAFFARTDVVDTFLVVNSCARGTAVEQSDLDFAVLLKPGTKAIDRVKLEEKWLLFSLTNADVLQFQKSHRFAAIHLDIFDGQFAAVVWDDGGGPDFFEVEIGNRLAYAAVDADCGEFFLHLQQQWLPYYSDELRTQRLQMVKNAMERDLDYIPFYLERKLYFAAFDRLYKAFGEFLQALFISRRVYPLAYNKWIQEQVAGTLQLPQLYEQLPAVISVQNIESREMLQKADTLRRLADEYCLL